MNFAKLPNVSKQALSKARKKLSPEAFVLLNGKLVTEFYSDNEISTFEGYRLLAIDGSTVQLPCSDDMINHFGHSKNQLGGHAPMARTSILFDVLNKITIHSKISPTATSEKKLALQHLECLLQIDSKTNDLLLFDRGYPSTSLIFTLQHKNKDFLMRCNRQFRGVINNAAKSCENDKIVTLRAFDPKRTKRNSELKKSLPHLKKDASIQIRVLTFELKNGEKEILITTLFDQEKFSPKRLFNLYAKRWDIEENYKTYKNIVEIENFSGKSILAIEQDFYATVLTSNMISLLIQEAQSDAEEKNKNKGLKYKYKINKKVSVGILKDELIFVLLNDVDLDKYCEKLKSQIIKYIVPIRPGRSFPRIKKKRSMHPWNQRRSL